MRIRGLLAVAILLAGASATAASTDFIETGLPRAVGAEPPGTTSIELTALPPTGFLKPVPRVPRSQRTAPPPPSPEMLAPEFPALTGLIAAPILLSALGIPEIILNAYRAAELEMMLEAPTCGVSWNLLAGIGRIESGHARGGRTDAVGTTLGPILGPVLDGHLAGNEIIRDTDGGRIDGDAQHDRAVGPMQFIPSTWASYASDGNGDGVADPHNIFDAALAAGRYLCAGGADLRDGDQLRRAVLRYNNSSVYATTVIGWAQAYGRGTTPDALHSPGSSAPSDASTAQLMAGTPSSPTPQQGTDTPEPEISPEAPPGPVPAFPGLPQLPPLPCLLCPPDSRE
ncbi:MAG: lytic transglycosylase [Rhodococcus sp.]|nr:lytic transglycosylase [Rhodococcus sp. (in: high G+C Gram-positive bacteria)]